MYSLSFKFDMLMFVHQFSLFLCVNPVIVIFYFLFFLSASITRLFCGQGSVENVNKVFNKLELEIELILGF